MSQTYMFGRPNCAYGHGEIPKKGKKSPFLFVGKHQRGLVKEGLELEEVNKVLR